MYWISLTSTAGHIWCSIFTKAHSHSQIHPLWWSRLGKALGSGVVLTSSARPAVLPRTPPAFRAPLRGTAGLCQSAQPSLPHPLHAENRPASLPPREHAPVSPGSCHSRGTAFPGRHSCAEHACSHSDICDEEFPGQIKARWLPRHSADTCQREENFAGSQRVTASCQIVSTPLPFPPLLLVRAAQ